ncbi:immunoglobulin superfamily member 6 [Discoglossus pictus]
MATRRLRCVLFMEILTFQYYCGVTDGCKVTMTQEETVNETPGRTANLSCNFRKTQCEGEPQIYWFRYLSSRKETLCNTTCKSRFMVRSSGQSIFLEIDNLGVNDSAIYICGVAYIGSNSLTSKTTGLGTTLVVRDKPRSVITPECTALITICVLLLIYCVAVFLLYAFQSKLKFFKNIKRKENTTHNIRKSYRGRRIIQAITQEYNKRYPRKSRKQSNVRDDDIIYQNTR